MHPHSKKKRSTHRKEFALTGQVQNWPLGPRTPPYFFKKKRREIGQLPGTQFLFYWIKSVCNTNREKLEKEIKEGGVKWISRTLGLRERKREKGLLLHFAASDNIKGLSFRLRQRREEGGKA